MIEFKQERPWLWAMYRTMDDKKPLLIGSIHATPETTDWSAEICMEGLTALDLSDIAIKVNELNKRRGGETPPASGADAGPPWLAMNAEQLQRAFPFNDAMRSAGLTEEHIAKMNARHFAGYAKELHETEQALGKALGYPWYKDDQKNFPDATEADGVCVGEHTAGTLAAEAAERLLELKAHLRRNKRRGKVDG